MTRKSMRYETASTSHHMRKPINKKAEMIGQIFVYSLSLIIVTAILIFGYSSIKNFITSGNAVELAKFKRDSQTYIGNYVTEFGSVGYKKLRLPRGAEQLCITHYNSQWQQNYWCDKLTNPANTNNYFVDYFRAGSMRERKNFFLFDNDGEYMDGWYVGNVSLIKKTGVTIDNCNLLCMNKTANGVNIKIIGKGNHAEITDPTWT